MKKLKVISLILCIAILASSLPFAVLAESDEFVYTAIGDSITAGNGLDYEEDMDQVYRFLPNINYIMSPEESYPVIAGNLIGADTVYNLGIEGMRSDEYYNMLCDPNGSINFFLSLIPLAGDEYDSAELTELLEVIKYHKLAISALKKSDLISICLGGNDIMQGAFIDDFLGLAVSSDYDMTGDFDISKVKNPFAFYMLCSSLTSSVTAEELGGNAFTEMLETVKSKITLKDIIEVIELLSTKNITESTAKRGQAIADNYSKIYTLIKEGKEITKEEYDYLSAIYAGFDEQMASASKIKFGKGFSDYELLENGRLNIYENSGRYFIAPINPDAEIMYIGLFVPGGNNYVMGEKEKNRFYNFLLNAAYLALSDIIDDNADIPAGVSEKELAMKKDSFDSRFSSLKKFVSGGSFLSNLKASTLSFYTIRNGGKAENLAESVDELLSDIPYVLLYNMLGKKIEDGIGAFNKSIIAHAAEDNVKYVDIYDAECLREDDVHPDAAGHAFIAEMIYNAYNSYEGPAAAIGNKTYATLAEAIDEIENGEVIRLLKDCSEKVNVEKVIRFTLNKNDHKFTGALLPGEGYDVAESGTTYAFTKAARLYKASLGSGTLTMKIGGANCGEFSFTPYVGGWLIKTKDGKYLSVSGNEIVYSKIPYKWSYNGKSFYSVVSKPVFGFYKKYSTVYLASEEGALKASSSSVNATAEFFTKTAPAVKLDSDNGTIKPPTSMFWFSYNPIFIF